ncbi:hypothetical protein DPSP01_014594 [Paraphaeosphaeria sporulosa]
MSTSTFDLQAEWRETCREFISATEIDLSVKSPTAEQITAKLDELDEAKEAKSRSKVGKAKRAVGNTLRAVQTIGSLLAQGAELTGFGGPANVTMNCVSFFIDAGFAYKKIADNIDDLFSRIGPIMERAEVYIKDRESRLVSIASAFSGLPIRNDPKQKCSLRQHSSKVIAVSKARSTF